MSQIYSPLWYNIPKYREKKEEWFANQNGGVKLAWEEMEKAIIKRVQERSAELADYKRIRKND